MTPNVPEPPPEETPDSAGPPSEEIPGPAGPPPERFPDSADPPPEKCPASAGSEPEEARLAPEVRDLAAGDLAAVMRIERACFPDPWHPEAFRRELARRRSGGYPRVLVDRGEVRAFAIAWFVEDEAHLANLAVSPESRRLGFGRALLLDFLAEARRRRSAGAWLEVRAGNAPARRLYEAHGFRAVGVRKGYYRKEGEDAVLMVLDFSTEGE